MKAYMLAICFAIVLIVSLEAAVPKNGTRRVRKVVRKVRKNSTKLQKSGKSNDVAKSESYHIPVVIAPLDKLNGRHPIPVNIEYNNNGHASGGPYLNAKIMRVISPHDAQIHVPNYEPPAEQHHDYGLQNSLEDDHISDGSDYASQNGYQDYNGDGSWTPELQDHDQQADDLYHEHLHVDDGHYQNYGDEDYGGDLSAIPGIPGVDYPIYSSLPETHFKCLQHSSTPGFYADVDTKCQVWHYCQPDGRHDRFLCPNGTIFDQLTRVCNWWYNVQCDDSLAMYDINFDLYRNPPANTIKASSLQTYDFARTSLPSQNLVVLPPDSPQIQMTENSFLEHLKSFEGRHHHRVGDYLPELNKISEPEVDDHNNYTPIQAAAHPYLDKYPHKMAPTPVVVVQDSNDIHEEDHQNKAQYNQPRSAALVLQRHIEYSPQVINDDSEPKYLPPINGPLYDEDSRYPREWENFKVILKPVGEEVDDDIPTYRERKATPYSDSSSPPNKKKFRVVKRRKLYKDQ